jgi:pimeloyl-ACP methyl ester carboxylesterase
MDLLGTRRAHRAETKKVLVALGAGAAALAAAMALNQALARRAERRHPPTGRFVEALGVRVHVKDYGSGPPLVLLHGNGSAIAELESSGLIALAARARRVIVMDRPGYGHTLRPRGRIWTARAQADLVFAVLQEMGVRRVTAFGHSWGALVACELALNHPDMVDGLALVSGYYFPTSRTEALLAAGAALPIIGPTVSRSISPPVVRLIWPWLMRRIFGPMPVPRKFASYPREMVLRPSQLQASVADTALMLPSAAALAGRYGELAVPVLIVAGEADQMVPIDPQSGRLHAEIPHSTLIRLRGAGHMIHQNCTHQLWAAIERGSTSASFKPERTGAWYS